MVNFREHVSCQSNGLTFPMFNVRWVANGQGFGSVHEGPCSQSSHMHSTGVMLGWGLDGKFNEAGWLYGKTVRGTIPGLITSITDGAQIHMCQAQYDICLTSKQSTVGQVWWTKGGTPFQALTAPARGAPNRVVLNLYPPGLTTRNREVPAKHRDVLATGPGPSGR